MKLNLSGTTLIQQLILQIVTGLIVAANPGIVKAQLTPDNTVGSTTRSDTVKGLNSDIIEGGATRGTNLFHSFTNFNVDAGRGVYFSNPADINNILTRVTGSSQSNIFGTLGVLGNANLFLINPNGISFGPNAQLDVKGSFVASTADRIIFDNYQFTTTNPTAPPLLTVNIPLDLDFRNNPGDITVKDSNLSGSGLGVPQDKILRLNAGSGKVIFDNGGILSRGSQVILEGGDVSLTNNAFIDVSASGGGSITINSRDLTMENSRLIAGIDALSGSANAQAGDIEINNSGLFTLHNSSVSNNVGFLGTGYAGQINIKAYKINISGGALIESTVLSGGTGYAGDIRIETSNLIVDGGFISTDAYNDNTFGIAGNIDIYSSNDVTVKNGGWISSDVFSDFGQNDGGLIFIQTNTLNLENGGVISTSTYGQGSAGYIKINATDGINISGYAKDENNKPIFYPSSPLIDDQGNVIYDRQGNVIYSENKLASSRIESEVKTFARGNGGFIDINTSNLNLKDGGVISTSTYGQGSAGYIDINATDGINISGYAKDENNKPIFDRSFPLTYDNQGNVIYWENKLASSRIESEVKTDARGNGGFIDISTSKLTLEDGGVISTSTYGQGSAGNIDINAKDKINISGYAKDENNESIFDPSFPLIDDQGNVIYYGNKRASSRIESNVESGAEGNAGNIKIDLNAGSLSLTDGGSITSLIRGYETLPNGTIDITASNITIDDQGFLSSLVSRGFNDNSFTLFNDGEGKGGNIKITTSNLTLKNGGVISTSTFGKGDAGNIDITAIGGEGVNISKDGFISSEAYSFDNEGNGADAGNITITTPTLNLEDGGYISADTEGDGNAGDISITAIGGEGVNISNWGVISSSVYGTGTAGKITIDTSNLMLDGGQIYNDATGTNDNITGKGQVGSIIIKAFNDVTVKNGGKISSEAFGDFYSQENGADAGKITITTPTLNLEDGGYISADTSGTGNAGNIMIKADNINIAGYNIDNIEYDWYNEYQDNNYSRITSNTSGSGKGGNIDITTYNNPNLNINVGDKTIISASTAAQGSGGNVKITAPQKINIQGKGTIEASTLNTGSAGTIEIRSNNLNLSNGLQIVTSTSNKGNAGDITFKIADNLKLTNSTISSGATSDSTGKAGNINIDPTLIELDGSQITVNSQGSGDGGNITLEGKNLNLNNSTISASTKSGQGGDITLNIPDTIRQNNSKIEASAGENGNGGNVTIKTKFIIGNGGNISANATQGKGGNIKITTQGIFGYKGKQIDASSETGVDGVVETNTPEVDPSQGLIDLPENLLTATIITNSCRQGQSSQNSNSLIVKGRGGLALTSDQLPSSSEVEVSLIAPTSVKSSSAINSTSANMEKTAFKTIIPAQGWEINSQGDVVLVGHSTGNPAERVNTAITCASN
jgi:filamentous hemagglutinin family protein